MEIGKLYNRFKEELTKVYPPGEATAICNMVFEHAGFSKTSLLSKKKDEPEEAMQIKMTAWLEQLKKQVPVQYVLKHAWFYNLKLNVGPAVLIPRPETEELVKYALEFLKQVKNPAVLDIGTGSGCIAVAVKKNNAGSIVTAIDVSSGALTIAKENAAAHEVIIDFRELDFLDTENRKQLKQFDCIVSNPPYIPLGEAALLDKNVTAFEPHHALFVPDDQPLIFYEAIAAFAKTHLKDNGKVFLETHENLAEKVAAHFLKNGFIADVQKDIFGKQRFVFAALQ
ncbi:MAG: peptide chain release factor N(5)-glutamine methyltransferase [Ferruginibacter sp.]